MTHIIFLKRGIIGYMYYFVACSVVSYCLQQCRHIVTLTATKTQMKHTPTILFAQEKYSF